MLSDPTGEVHDRYGVASRLGGILRDRVTFVLDREGVVRHVFSSGLRMRAHVDESLAVVRRLATPPPPVKSPGDPDDEVVALAAADHHQPTVDEIGARQTSVG